VLARASRLHAAPRRAAADRVQALAENLLDAAERAGRLVVAGYALPIPATIIAVLLGEPPQDQRRFHGRSKHVVSASTPAHLSQP
jgi:cytochrome P450